jgi:hypothetical protein
MKGMIQPRRSRLIATLACVVALSAIAGAGSAQAAFLGDIVQPYDTIRSANALLQVDCSTSFANGYKLRTFRVDLYTYGVDWAFPLEVKFQVYANGKLTINQPFTRVGRMGNLHYESNWVPASYGSVKVQVFEQFRVWTSSGWAYAPYGVWETASHSTNGYGNTNSCTLY